MGFVMFVRSSVLENVSDSFLMDLHRFEIKTHKHHCFAVKTELFENANENA